MSSLKISLIFKISINERESPELFLVHGLYEFFFSWCKSWRIHGEFRVTIRGISISFQNRLVRWFYFPSFKLPPVNVPEKSVASDIWIGTQFITQPIGRRSFQQLRQAVNCFSWQLKGVINFVLADSSAQFFLGFFIEGKHSNDHLIE